LSNKKFLDNLL